MDERLKRAVDTLGDKLRDEIAKELATLNLAPAHPQDAATPARLADAVAEIDRAASLSDILETLADAARQESPRAGVFLLSGGRLRAFRVFGLPEDADQLPADLRAVPLMLAGAQIGSLYVERGDNAAIDILVRFASRSLEAMTALKTARAFADGQIA